MRLREVLAVAKRAGKGDLFKVKFRKGAGIVIGAELEDDGIGRLGMVVAGYYASFWPNSIEKVTLLKAKK